MIILENNACIIIYLYLDVINKKKKIFLHGLKKAFVVHFVLKMFSIIFPLSLAFCLCIFSPYSLLEILRQIMELSKSLQNVKKYF